MSAHGDEREGVGEMGISIKEGLDLAEREAWRARGKDHAWWFTTGKRIMPWVAVAAGIGLLGLGAWWLWNKAAETIGSFSGPGSIDTPAVPGAAWLIALVLLALSVLVVKGPSHARSFPVILMQAGILLTGWFALAVYIGS